MECSNIKMAFAAKEEILRNIIKTHNVILIEGWTGTGKTVTTLNSVKGMGDVYYYGKSAGDPPLCAGQADDKLTVVKNAGDLNAIKPGKQFIIFDDLDHLGSEARSILKDLIKAKTEGRKILVITPVVLDAQDLLEYMDAVVRFRPNTAEMLHSKLYNPGS
jgi:Cdc6-like AAA superfamily ATPase